MRRQPSLRRAALALACSLGVACAAAHIVGPLASERGTVRGADSLELLGHQNWEALERTREIESSFYQNVGLGGRPRSCLALSGGGLRSAFFSIGVMKALSSELEELDIISGVSGGSYATAWYFAQQWHRGRADWSPLFADAEIARLGKESRRYRRLFPDLKRPCSWIPVWVTDPVAIFFNWLGRAGYVRSVIRGTDRINKNILQAIFLQSSDSEAAPSLKEIGRFIAEQGLPLFVISASIRELDDHPLESKRLRDTLFEITPAWMGADSVGHKDYAAPGSELPIDELADAVLVSGAALDKSKQAIMAASAELHDLGQNLSWEGVAAGQPYSYIRVADGGFVENLGAFVLIRRLCDRITIVDAEEDPWFEFDGYWKLKRAVRHELKADLYVKAIEECCPEKTPSENDLGAPATPKTHAFKTESPVMTGTVGRFPISDGGQQEELTLAVRYIKLSINETMVCALRAEDKEDLTLEYRAALARYGESVVDYYLANHNRDEGCQERFPHLPTWNQFYDETRARAFVDLGYYLARGAGSSEAFGE